MEEFRNLPPNLTMDKLARSSGKKISAQCIKMSSVLRSIAQSPSRTLHVGDNSTRIVSAAEIAAWAEDKGAIVNGSSILFNMTDSVFGTAIFDLYDDYSTTYVDSYVSLKDMGKKIYIGMTSDADSVLAGKINIVTMTLVKVLQGDNRDSIGYAVTAVDATNTITDNAGSSLDVDVGRGAI